MYKNKESLVTSNVENVAGEKRLLNLHELNTRKPLSSISNKIQNQLKPDGHYSTNVLAESEVK